MNRKLALCAASALTIFAGGSYLATPAHASVEAMKPCSVQTALAINSIVDAGCALTGQQGVVTELTCNDQGTATFTGACY